MAIEFTCSGCSNTLRVPDEHAGKQARCPQCSSVNAIPGESQIPSPAPTNQPSPTGDMFGALPSQQKPPAPAVSTNPYAEPQQHAGYATSHNPYAQPGYPAQQRHYAPHRGGLILAMGIMSFVCNFMLIPGILAWTMGRSDLREIKAGRMDPSGEGITTAGMVLGIIATSLIGLLFLFYVVVIIIGIGAGVAGM